MTLEKQSGKGTQGIRHDEQQTEQHDIAHPGAQAGHYQQWLHY
jgi:hypothetical protein